MFERDQAACLGECLTLRMFLMDCFPGGHSVFFHSYISYKLEVGKKVWRLFLLPFWGLGWRSLRKSESSLLGTTFLKTQASMTVSRVEKNNDFIGR